jgi:hypothetical protein
MGAYGGAVGLRRLTPVSYALGHARVFEHDVFDYELVARLTGGHISRA